MMNERLQHLIVEADAKLRPEEQERLADIVEAFVANRAAGNEFTPEEMALLREIDAEPFEPVDPEGVRRFLPERDAVPARPKCD